ncbi:hypothetical protein FXO38_10748 [Capsicum annuum]|nr:hypothetical protein FXO38_10748 [Capsicum annuum]
MEGEVEPQDGEKMDGEVQDKMIAKKDPKGVPHESMGNKLVTSLIESSEKMDYPSLTRVSVDVYNVDLDNEYVPLNFLCGENLAINCVLGVYVYGEIVDDEIFIFLSTFYPLHFLKFERVNYIGRWQIKHHSDPYFLLFLTVDESWKLLQKKVFQGEICPSEILGAGLRVAKSCKGLPLVIVLTAGIIVKQILSFLWLDIAKDLSSHVLEEQSTKIIESSYNFLEHHLKSCLLYMGLFRENYKFPVFNLLKLWIAEDFVYGIMGLENMDMEEASKTFLNDLINRSLVIVSNRREDNGEIIYCTVHDVVCEFFLRKLPK